MTAHGKARSKASDSQADKGNEQGDDPNRWPVAWRRRIAGRASNTRRIVHVFFLLVRIFCKLFACLSDDSHIPLRVPDERT